jgi:glutamine synthetase
LEEALDALDKDRKFLTIGNVFSDDLIDAWINFKLENEFYRIRNRPHPYEFELYFDL